MLDTTVEFLEEGRRLRVARLGSGPPIVLLHGYPDNLQIWGELAQRLARRYSVIAFDWPGMGRSDAWPGGTTPQHQAARLKTLLDRWGIERAAVVGMDMGGQPALAFAAANPDRCAELVVMNSLVFGEEKTSWEIRVLRRFGWNRVILRRLAFAVFRRAEHTFLPRGVRLPMDLRRDLWETFREPRVREFIVRLCAGYQGTLSRLPALYSLVTAPTLVLWGERDRHFPVQQAARLHEAIPHSRLAVLPEGEHWMAWHMPDEVDSAMKSMAE